MSTEKRWRLIDPQTGTLGESFAIPEGMSPDDGTAQMAGGPVAVAYLAMLERGATPPFLLATGGSEAELAYAVVEPDPNENVVARVTHYRPDGWPDHLIPGELTREGFDWGRPSA